MGWESDLREAVSYNEGSGELRWNVRPINHFRGKNVERTAKIWNSKYAGNLAFNSLNGHGYLQGCFNRKFLLAHRVAWFLATDIWPEIIDHINHEKTDNRIENLRSVNQRDNQRNSSRYSRTRNPYFGVSRSSITSWSARIHTDGETEYLGSFMCLGRAVSARRQAEKRHGYHKNHGLLNGNPVPEDA